MLALVVPERAVAYQILALNIEKAHNLREKRARGGPDVPRPGRARAPRTRDRLALEFEEPALVTLGFAYEKRPRLSGGAYHPILRKVDGWLDRQAVGAAPRSASGAPTCCSPSTTR